jgi:hypothetical protein
LASNAQLRSHRLCASGRASALRAARTRRVPQPAAGAATACARTRRSAPPHSASTGTARRAAGPTRAARPRAPVARQLVHAARAALLRDAPQRGERALERLRHRRKQAPPASTATQRRRGPSARAASQHACNSRAGRHAHAAAEKEARRARKTGARRTRPVGAVVIGLLKKRGAGLPPHRRDAFQTAAHTAMARTSARHSGDGAAPTALAAQCAATRHTCQRLRTGCDEQETQQRPPSTSS